MLFQPAQLIQKKRDGHALTKSEFEFLINGIVKGTIPDYQASAFLMAVYFKGLSLEETCQFTEIMFRSGEILQFAPNEGAFIDKHSTGGLGDKVSIILAPLAAECGLKVPMMAGRSLGHTGGTIDKLEAIPGFRTLLKPEEVRAQLKEIGCVIYAQNERVAPADRKLYALRDVTATVECSPLIVGSILSKKIAEGAHGLVMDIKVGNGAFLKTKDQAKKLGKWMVSVGKNLGLEVRGLITQMDQPLGDTVGNAIEINECLTLLRTGRGPQDLKELTLQLTAQMLTLGKICPTMAAARKLAKSVLDSGKAWPRFLKMVEFQGGSKKACESAQGLPLAPVRIEVLSPKTGYITHMDCEPIGRLLIDWGAGRRKTGDPVDPGVGIHFLAKLGDRVVAGKPIAEIFLSTNTNKDAAAADLLSRIEIKSQRKAVPPLVHSQNL